MFNSKTARVKDQGRFSTTGDIWAGSQQMSSAGRQKEIFLHTERKPFRRQKATWDFQRIMNSSVLPLSAKQQMCDQN